MQLTPAKGCIISEDLIDNNPFFSETELLWLISVTLTSVSGWMEQMFETD